MHVAHELRLQFLRAALAANVHRAFLAPPAFRPTAPGASPEPVIAERAPHDPPAVAAAFHHSAIRAGATVKRTWNVKQNCLRHEHSTVDARVIVAEDVGRRLIQKWPWRAYDSTSFTCTANIFPAGAEIRPAAPASPRQSVSDPRPLQSRRTPLDSPAIRHLLQLEIVGIKLVQCRRQLNP